ncbi:response regulator [Candidatus Latescibacterota bacterium]
MGKSSILIVEDEVLVARNIEITLKKHGYSISGKAISGEEAIQKAEKTMPDLVLMDITLKGEMDGIETAEIIKEKFGIPIIYLTAHDDKEKLSRAIFTNPYGYIVKPFYGKQLSISIDMALYKKNIDDEKQKMHDEAKVLYGFLSICSNCKKIRDEEGGWEEIIDYIRENSEAEFTHSICPDCVNELYPEILWNTDIDE